MVTLVDPNQTPKVMSGQLVCSQMGQLEEALVFALILVSLSPRWLCLAASSHTDLVNPKSRQLSVVEEPKRQQLNSTRYQTKKLSDLNFSAKLSTGSEADNEPLLSSLIANQQDNAKTTDGKRQKRELHDPSAGHLEPVYFGRYPRVDLQALRQAIQAEEQVNRLGPQSQSPHFYGHTTDHLGRQQPMISPENPFYQDNNQPSELLLYPNSSQNNLNSSELISLHALDPSLGRDGIEPLTHLTLQSQPHLVNKFRADYQKNLEDIHPEVSVQKKHSSFLSPNSSRTLLNANQLAGLLSQLKVPLNDVKQDAGESDSNEKEPASESEDDQRFLASLMMNDSKTPGQPVFLGQKQLAGSSEPETINEVSDTGSKKTIPIERLVDHLMANSRLSTFGIQHDGLALPEGEEEALEEEDDDEEQDREQEQEQEEDDPENEEIQESKPVASKLSPFPGNLSFSSVLNKSSSWIPLDALDGSASKQDKLASQKFNRENKLDKRDSHVKNRKKRKKKKKKRKKKSIKEHNSLNEKSENKKKTGFALILGDKMLNGADLIRLIGILNKMNKKSPSSKEREASGRMLRFIIKLMLKEYKRHQRQVEESRKSEANKDDELPEAVKPSDENSGDSKDEPMRDMLRSLIEGPHLEMKDPESDKIDPNQKDEQEEEHGAVIPEKVDQAASIDQLIDDENRNKSQASSIVMDRMSFKSRPRSGRNRVGLSELSDNLESYFDSDFYEDMADKMDANKTNSGSASGTNVLRLAPKKGRKVRVVYTVPVPIYGQRLYEAADEDDTDFDSLPVKHRRRKRRRGRVQNQRRRRRLKMESDEPESEDDEQEDRDEGEEEPPKSEEPPGTVSLPRTRFQRVKLRRREPLGLPSNDNVENEAEEEEDEPQVEPDATKKPDSRAGSRRSKPRAHRNQKKVPSDKSKKRRLRRLRRRKQPNQGKMEIDHEKRYEIPAPIVAGKIVAESNLMSYPNGSKNSMGRPQGAGSTRSDKILMRKPAPPKMESTTNSSEIISRHNRWANNEKDIAKGRRESGEDPPERSGSEPVDEDYYNEGTSYSKVCSDDGKCKVSVKSSNPKLKGVIKTGDQKGIEKEISPWLSKQD